MHRIWETLTRPVTVKEIGRNLRRIRKEAGLTQEDLADISGLTRQLIVRSERGYSALGSESIVKLAGALGVHPGAFYEPVTKVALKQ